MSTSGVLELSLPFTGRWLVQNSPARRVPSHGTDLLGGRYAIDFVGVDVQLRTSGAFLVLAHLQRGSVRVTVGEEVHTGEELARCGNSGNSTQPHVHLQVMDAGDPSTARGVPLAFRHYREWTSRGRQPRAVERGMPGEGAVVEPLADPSAG